MGSNTSIPSSINYSGAVTNYGAQSASVGYGAQTSVQIPDKYHSYAELEAALREAGIESIQLIVGFDFSKSNDWSGEKSYGCPLHTLQGVNPYQRVINILEPLVPHFDDDNIIPAFRFGCVESRDKIVLPLCAPAITDPHFAGFAGLKQGYIQAVQTTRMAGPTTFAPMIYQAIEIEKAYGGKQLLFLLLLTDGDVANMNLDKQAICDAANFPISICAVGLGDGPFEKMIEFDDMPGRRFDNFQFVDFTTFEKASQRCEFPDLALATQIFNELPDQVKAMKQLGLL